MVVSEFDNEKISRYFKGGNSEEESSYVREIFCDKSKERELKTFLSKQFDEIPPEDILEDKNLDHILYRIHYDINTKSTENIPSTFNTIINWTFRIAGIIMLPILIFFAIQTYKGSNEQKEAWVEIKAPAWTRAQFSLPDGTTGWLNSNSSIKYNGNFNSDRTITLTGEAFFDVFEDKRRPFKVNTNEVSLEVLGTRFNIASYADEKNIEVVLEQGKLLFNNKEMNKSYMMNPNDLVVYDKTQMDFTTEVVQPQKYLSWTEGKLVFRNDPLDAIVRRLGRWYNIDVEINGNLTEDLRLRATFIDESLEEVLDLLRRSLPVDYGIEMGDLLPDGTYTKKKLIIKLGTK